jgi:aminoglycoside phosphotransferase (APT) family kinase protein
MEGRDFERESAQVRAWLEAQLGGRVVSLNRQPRWRPVWFADVERGGETLELCVRGERIDAEIGFSLDHEMRFQRCLHEQGIPVATVYGWIDEPRAYVMDRVAGQADFSETSDTDRRSVMDAYIDVLARIHGLDPEPFERAGVHRAATPSESGVIGMQRYETFYRKSKRRPDPFLEFCLAWLKRNPLDVRGREAPIVWDSGQFHHKDGRIQAVLDLELGHVGDPMMDLAGFRMRDSVIGYGEFPRMYERYAAITGNPVDGDAIRHHHLSFTLTNQLAFHAALAEPVPGSDYMTNLQWCSETNLFAVEALAEILDVELEEVEIPDSRQSPIEAGQAHLVHWLRHFESDDEVVRNDVRTAFRLARHLARFDEIGTQLIEADLDDLEPLLGGRPSSWQAGDSELEAFIAVDGGKHDDALLGLFHRRLTRSKATLGPAGSAMARHHPLQPFSD